MRIPNIRPWPHPQLSTRPPNPETRTLRSTLIRSEPARNRPLSSGERRSVGAHIAITGCGRRSGLLVITAHAAPGRSAADPSALGHGLRQRDTQASPTGTSLARHLAPPDGFVGSLWAIADPFPAERPWASRPAIVGQLSARSRCIHSESMRFPCFSAYSRKIPMSENPNRRWSAMEASFGKAIPTTMQCTFSFCTASIRAS
jgi:hypothetical protein